METKALHPCGAEACPLSRRQFVGRSTAAAVVALLGAACGDGQIGAGGNPLGPPLAGGEMTIRIGDYPALANVGGIARVDTGSGAVALVRQSQSAFLALSMRCPHQGTTVNIRNGAFVCPNHNATFAADGAWTGGQSTSRLVSIPVTWDAAAGTLTLGVVPGGGAGGGDDDDDDDDDDEDEDDG